MATTLKWAVYLGVSWTWCIGMFLPVLLVRDFGFWAFWSFAVPNVVGAAGMGLVLSSAGASERAILQHRGACIWFSRGTMAYQAFFVAWILPQLFGGGAWGALAAAGVFPVMIAVVASAVVGDRDFSWSTLAAWVVSLAVAVALGSHHALSLPPLHGMFGGARAAGQIAPVCMLGFLLCPYLDLTFHRGFQRAWEAGGGRAARGAFAVGFGVIFAAMILLTLFYARAVIEGRTWARVLVGVHMGVQLAVTIVLHQVESSRLRRAAGAASGVSFWPAVLVGAGLGAVAHWVPNIGGWQAGEYVYRAFLAMYGLAFPVYVLFMMVPSLQMSRGLMVATMLAALPAYAAGFLSADPAWLVAGVGVVVIGFIASLWQAKYAAGRGRGIA